ncbi:MAG TPA: hypothetical protein VF837_01600 [Patescibacteria group bacterium]
MIKNGRSLSAMSDKRVLGAAGREAEGKVEAWLLNLELYFLYMFIEK